MVPHLGFATEKKINAATKPLDNYAHYDLSSHSRVKEDSTTPPSSIKPLTGRGWRGAARLPQLAELERAAANAKAA